MLSSISATTLARKASFAIKVQHRYRKMRLPARMRFVLYYSSGARTMTAGITAPTCTLTRINTDEPM
jgi:hypothetical protein